MKKLRRNIFWSIELSALSVLFLILLIFNLFKYFQYDQKEWQMLSSIMDSAEESLLFDQSFKPDNKSDSDDFKQNHIFLSGKKTFYFEFLV